MLVTDAFGGAGGIAKFNRDLTTAIASMPDCAEVVVTPRIMGAAPEPIPPRITFITRGVDSKLRFIWSALSEGLRGHLDAVIVGHVNLAPLGALLARLRGVPSVLFVYGIDAWTPHRSALVRWSISRFTSIASISEVTAKRFSRWSEVDSSKLTFLPPCVDLSRYGAGPKSPQLLERLGLQDRTILMTLGRLDSEARQDLTRSSSSCRSWRRAFPTSPT